MRHGPLYKGLYSSSQAQRIPCKRFLLRAMHFIFCHDSLLASRKVIARLPQMAGSPSSDSMRSSGIRISLCHVLFSRSFAHTRNQGLCSRSSSTQGPFPSAACTPVMTLSSLLPRARPWLEAVLCLSTLPSLLRIPRCHAGDL